MSAESLLQSDNAKNGGQLRARARTHQNSTKGLSENMAEDAKYLDHQLRH